MGFFSNSAKRPVRILLLVLLAPILINIGWCGIKLGIAFTRMMRANRNDAKALYSVVAEAEANIQADPDFVNPATEELSMAYIPYEYYSYVQSEWVFSRAYVVIYQDGALDAFYGTPSLNLEYYSKYLDRNLIPTVCAVAAVTIVPVGVGVLIVCRKKKRKNIADCPKEGEDDTEQP